MIALAGRVVGLDIGSRNVRAVLAEARPDTGVGGNQAILGHGRAEARGVEGPDIVDPAALSAAVRDAIGGAEEVAGREAEAVCVGVPSHHVRSWMFESAVDLGGRPVSERHLLRLQTRAAEGTLPHDRRVIHVWRHHYTLDGTEVDDPLGHKGSRLRAGMRVFAATSRVCGQLAQVVDRAGYTLDALAMGSIAAAGAVLGRVETASSTALISVGASACDVLLFADGRIQHAAAIPWAGESMSRDLSRGLGVPLEVAEQAKLDHGFAMLEPEDSDVRVPVGEGPNGQPRRVSRALLVHIIQERFDEILNLAKKEIGDAGEASRIVLSGGGVMLPRTERLAQDVFGGNRNGGVAIRVGVPRSEVDEMSSPAWATAAGLAQYGAERRRPRGLEGAGNALSRAGQWLREYF